MKYYLILDLKDIKNPIFLNAKTVFDSQKMNSKHNNKMWWFAGSLTSNIYIKNICLTLKECHFLIYHWKIQSILHKDTNWNSLKYNLKIKIYE